MMKPITVKATIEVSAGMVIMEGDGIQVTWTPEAAMETGRALLAAGIEAAAAVENGEVGGVTDP